MDDLWEIATVALPAGSEAHGFKDGIGWTVYRKGNHADDGHLPVFRESVQAMAECIVRNRMIRHD